MVLTFKSGTIGTAAMDFFSETPTTLPSGKSFAFTGYKQVWAPSASTLKVTFNLNLPHCILAITALFRAQP